MSEKAHFTDPIHGHVFFQETATAVLSTYEVQRLQAIRQLSTCYLVYRSANHTRFEHSVGVSYLAGRAVQHWQLDARECLPPGVALTERDRLVAEIAGIIHDIGHGPFGHMCETVLRWSGAPEDVCDHEMVTHHVVKGDYRDIDKEHYGGLEPLASVLEKIAPKVDMKLDEFASMVKGDLTPDRLFLAELISSPIDVDRLDFIPRDTLFAGTFLGRLDIDSLINSLVVVRTTPEISGKLWPASELAVDISGLTGFEAMLTTRDHLYAEIYSQAINRAAQAMLVRATKRLLDDDGIDQRQLVRMTDEQLLLTLQAQKDEYAKDVARRIRTRQIFNRIPELEYIYDDFNEAGRWDEIYRYTRNPELILEEEDRIASELSPPLDSGKLIIDLPWPKDARLFEKEAFIRTRAGPQKLDTVSTLVRFMNKNAIYRRWRMMVFAPLARTDGQYDQIVKKVKERFELGEPREYPCTLK